MRVPKPLSDVTIHIVQISLLLISLALFYLAGKGGNAHLHGLAVGRLQDVARAHALAVDHVLARRRDDVHLHQPSTQDPSVHLSPVSIGQRGQGHQEFLGLSI